MSIRRMMEVVVSRARKAGQEPDQHSDDDRAADVTTRRPGDTGAVGLPADSSRSRIGAIRTSGGWPGSPGRGCTVAMTS